MGKVRRTDNVSARLVELALKAVWWRIPAIVGRRKRMPSFGAWRR
jgi:hypothetical protein